ncbi:nucleotidyltransferase domain-containing protein [Sphingobium aromaticiconvertens]|uniref:nucleotidyltransferase domain-containing protein n=1 Tax=Sphingobium aromaticiconvertens TaxID=365341 RepID=UPI0030167FDE
MTIAAVALYGSQARGDAVSGSDVDLLMITDEDHARHVSMGTLSIYLYPWTSLLRDAQAGDLFLCHIVREARSLHDPENRLGSLAGAFRFKPNYADEIRKASDLAWYLANFPDTLDGALGAKRVAWTVRTILIARAAERHSPCFAADALVAFSGLPLVGTLIGRKDEQYIAEDTPNLLACFLQHYGLPAPIRDGSPADYHAYFAVNRNDVALQTLRTDLQDNFYS